MAHVPGNCYDGDLSESAAGACDSPANYRGTRREFFRNLRRSGMNVVG